MELSAAIDARIARTDQIAADAIGVTAGLGETFNDVSSIQLPIFIPKPITSALPPVTITDDPIAPDNKRIESAVAAVGKMPTKISEIDGLKSALDASLSVFSRTFSEVQARIPQITSLAAQIVIPQATDMQFTEGDFRAGNNIDAVLKSIIASEIQKGGEGYDSDTEAAMYDLGGERAEQVRQEAIDEALDNASGTGFSMPQGHHIEAVRKINEQYRLDAEKKSNDTMMLQSKLSLENKWRALNAGISYNQILLAYFDTKAQRALEAAIAVLSLNLAGIKFRTDTAKQELEIGKAANKAVMDRTRITIERYTVELIKYRKQMDGLFAMAKGYTEQYRAKGHVYGIDVEAAAEKSRLDQAENKFSLENQKLNIVGFMTSAQQALSAFIATAGLKLGSATDGANLQKAIAMATFDSLGTIINRIKTGEYSVSG